MRPTDVADLEIRPVPGFPGYYATSEGRVFSVFELVHEKGRDGYLRVRTFVAGKKKRPGVHVMLALAFHGLPQPGEEVRHLDGNPANNAVSNLAWGTKKQNGEDKARHGSSKGEKNGRSRLTRQQVLAIRASSKTLKELAEEHEVSIGTIGAIRTGRNWGWVKEGA